MSVGLLHFFSARLKGGHTGSDALSGVDGATLLEDVPCWSSMCDQTCVVDGDLVSARRLGRAVEELCL